jgi:hypothetical protein
MPITGINWKDDEGYDIHLLRGNGRGGFIDALEFTKTDGTTEDAATYLAANADVALDFQPSFRNTLDLTVTPPVCTGFGITINNETGEIDLPSTADPVIHNFLLHATARDSTDGKDYRTSIRIHLHNRVTSAWLSPPVLTLRPEGATLPQTTNLRFSVRVQFDDETVGDLTHHPDLIWRPASNVSASGLLRIAPGNGPATPAVEIEAVLPSDFDEFSDPNPPEIKATGHIRFAVDWAADSTIRTDTVQIQDTWPGTINPEVVPNFLFLCDGYRIEDKAKFEGQVTSLLGLMKRSQITRPFDLLSTSMNYFRAFVPSDHHGISVLCEVFPNQDADGNLKTETDGTVKLFSVPDPEDPSSGDNWTVENVIFRLGLPVPGQGLIRTVAQTRAYWDSIVDDLPHDKISDKTVRGWQKLSKRTFLEETDSVFGLAYGDYPRASGGSDNNEIGFHPLRMRRSGLDPILNRLADPQGNPMGSIWMERPDGTRPNSYKLIFIFSSLKWDRGVNFSRGYISMNVEDRDSIPARRVTGKPTWEIDLTGKITGNISHSRLIRGCHEIAHSFGLGDEYNEGGTMPQGTEVDANYGNLQKHSDIEDPTTHDIDGDRIKWRWHRIRKAAVIVPNSFDPTKPPITEVQPGKFRVPVILGQANQFAMGDTVLLRVRQFPDPLPRIVGAGSNLSNHLEVIGIADPGGPQEGAIIVTAKTGQTFTASDAANFPEGCIIYLPVPAKSSVRSDDYPFAELIAKNIKDHITGRKRALNQDPGATDICVPDKNDIQQPVKLTVDLPICFSHKNRIVSLFTGGKKFACGVYHPTGSCIMRNSNGNGKEFCAVCRYLLVDSIDPFKHFSIDRDYEEIYPQT